MVETPRNNEETNATNPVGKTENFVSKHFVRLLVWLAVSGGALAIFGPWLLYVTGLTGETDANLRLHILYITGGTIAVLGLVETHRKNTVDHEKAKVEKENYKKTQAHQTSVLEEQQRQFNVTTNQERKKIKADKAKNEQDHIRQVHAERRSRYTTAVEQLSSDKASIRLGGVYTLVGLVDEWLADEKTIPSIEERHKEGQVIINNLCAYIRSPFLLAERAGQLDKPYTKDLQKDFGGDKDADKQTFKQHKATLEEERQVRLSIIKEMHEHLHDAEKPGPWSAFNYDFSNTHFFYVVSFNHSYLSALLNFSGAKFTRSTDFSEVKFTKDANFSGAKFAQETYFSGVKFTKDANFSGAHFHSIANFSWTHFHSIANFSGTHFHSIANFSGTHFHRDATFSEKTDFSGAHFHSIANFSWAEFTGDAHFSEVEFTGDAKFSEAKFTGDANFSMAKFTKDANFSMAKFTKDANFSEAKFTGDANFSTAEFTGDANFLMAKFTKKANFSVAKFTKKANFSVAKFTKDAKFSWAEFIRNADFFEATFEEKPIFEYELYSETFKAKFSHRANPEDYNFKVSHYSPYKIETEEQEHNGIKFIIPKGTELFDPDEPSE